MRQLFITLASIVCFAFPQICSAQQYPFQDTSINIDLRVSDLIGRLTLDEKLSLLEHQNPAIPRLGLKAYSWWNEALHGVGRNGTATVWPMPIALAASFNDRMVENIFACVAADAHKKYHESQAQGNYGDYAGLTFFTPNINIFRDPRWGRGMETYGEDPYLTATMGLACVNGLQHGDNDKSILSAGACLKHFAVHSGPEGTRHQFDANVSQRDLWTTYLPAFEYIISHSDVKQVMCGYNRLNGTPCCTNRELLVDILRNKWHYDGIVVTDCWALNDCWERDTVIPRHKTHATAALAASDAFGSEVDLECGSGLQALKIAVDSGYIPESKINEHLRRVLLLRMKLTESNPNFNFSHEITPHDAATETFVLLKNDDVLPINGKRIFLAGPNANDTLMPLGNYNGTPLHTSTISEGLSQRFSMVETATNADIIVYAGGLNPQLEGEELPIDIPGFHKGDRTRIELPENQVDEIKQLKKLGKPLVLLLCSGSAIALENIIDETNAIMVCWYGGEDMGKAIASALAGDCDNFGRLPVTFYKSTAQLPDFDDYNMQGRTYKYMSEKPLFPFGYGLSYSDFRISNINIDIKEMHITGTVRNNGSKAQCKSGKAVIQVYLSYPKDKKTPKKTLVGIAKLDVPVNGECEFNINIDRFWLRKFNEKTGEMEEPAHGEKMILQVGSSSDDKDLENFPFKYIKQ
ncbi:MAG: glycoside hydrolase family 3 C-terminal domain-containing protein [Bacteroidales bacterium]|nr:glycoside hydrolase family 3 C-terminal domain-containing protein [Bacteroidales bacterium]